MKLWLARVATRLEAALGRGRTARQAGAIVPYIGYATADHLIARGRVLAGLRDTPRREGQGIWRNLRQMLGLFITGEVANVTVSCGDVTGVTDDEGYFTILLPRDDATGWRTVRVTAGPASADCPVMVADPSATLGVISDIDDTMMQTGAYSIWRNLWTSLTGNAATRVVFPDAVELMTQLSDGGRNPVHYVSSSPWNFHGFLAEVLDRNGLPRGPMFLRDYGFSETQFITGTHGDHKGSAIDVVLGALPDLPFVLIGDTGQHDAEVYLAAARRHPGRISRVILHVPADGTDRDDAEHVAALRALGVTVDIGLDYSAALSRQLAGGGE